jgi:hypothetical protein
VSAFQTALGNATSLEMKSVAGTSTLLWIPPLIVGLIVTLALFDIVALPVAVDAGIHAFPIESIRPCGGTVTEHSPAELNVTQFDTGRYRLSLPSVSEGHACMELSAGTGRISPRRLRVRLGATEPPLAVVVSGSDGDAWQVIGRGSLYPARMPGGFDEIALASSHPEHEFRLDFSLQNSATAPPMQIGEIALFQPTAYGKWHDFVLFSEDRSAITLLEVISILGIAGFLFFADRRVQWAAPLFAFTLVIAVGTTALRQQYPLGRDFRLAVQTLHLQSLNLTETVKMGSRLLKGNGLTDFGGSVDTYRMPGHALMTGLAGWIFHVDPKNLTDLVVSLVYFQLIFLAASLAVFTASFILLVPRGVAALVSIAIAWFPPSFDYTQGDSVILACGLLISAALCYVLVHRPPAKVIGLWPYVLVHAAFALYFSVRTDVLPGWIVVSLILHWKNWRYLAIPACFFAVVGVPWGLYKRFHGSDFVMTTSNAGHVAFVGLWEVPERFNRFTWRAADESYDKWITSHGFKYADPKTTGFAEREILRFYLTYPGYVISNFIYKLENYLTTYVWTGTLTPPPSFSIGERMRRYGALILLTAIIFACVAGCERRRTILLGWPVLFNLPLFCIVQDSAGRFVPYVSCSLLIAGLPLLFDMQWYSLLFKKRLLAMATAIIGVTLAYYGSALSTSVLMSDGFRYWTPLLDPARSTLSIFK